MNWDGHYVKVVFVCALTLNVHPDDRKIVEGLYEIINDCDLIGRLLDATKKKTF